MADYKLTAKHKGTFWEKHSLSIVIGSIFIVFTLISIFSGHHVWVGEQILNDLSTTDMSEFWIWWIFEYKTSLVADVFGAVLLVLLTKRLREEGSNEDD